MSFFDSLRLAIALGLTLFLVLLRFDSERITRSDYFRYRTPWMGPVSRASSGTSRNSSSAEPAPIVSSIAERSGSLSGKYLISLASS